MGATCSSCCLFILHLQILLSLLTSINPNLHCSHYFPLVPKTRSVLNVIFSAYQLLSMAPEHISVTGRRIIWFNEIWVMPWLGVAAHIYFFVGKLSISPRILMLALLWLTAGDREVIHGSKVLLHPGLSVLFLCLLFCHLLRESISRCSPSLTELNSIQTVI